MATKGKKTKKKNGGLHFCFLTASKTPEASIVHTFYGWVQVCLSSVREQNCRPAGELVRKRQY